MIRHVAVFTWKPGTAASQIEELRRALSALPGTIPEIRRYCFGSDHGLGGNADFAVVADFEDEAGYRAFAAHPDHQRVIAESVAPIREARMAIQFALPSAD